MEESDGLSGARDEVEGLGLAIARLRADLLEARQAGAEAEIQLPVELKVVAAKGLDGKAGSRCRSSTLSWAAGRTGNMATQTVTVRFGEQVDRDGNLVKVASTGAQRKG